MKMSVSSPEAVPPLDSSQEGEGTETGSVTRRPSLMSRLSSAVGTEGEPGTPGGLLRRLSTSIQFKRKGSSTPSLNVDEIPATFLISCKGNVEKAGKKWQASKQWRAENDIGECVNDANLVQLKGRSLGKVVLYAWIEWRLRGGKTSLASLIWGEGGSSVMFLVHSRDQHQCHA